MHAGLGNDHCRMVVGVPDRPMATDLIDIGFDRFVEMECRQDVDNVDVATTAPHRFDSLVLKSMFSHVIWFQKFK